VVKTKKKELGGVFFVYIYKGERARESARASARDICTASLHA